MKKTKKKAPELTTISAAVPKAFAERVREAADKEDRPVSWWIKWALAKVLDES